MRFTLVTFALLAVGCRNWGALSTNYDAGTDAGGGSEATGGGAVGGGSSAGGSGGAGGGAAGGGATGGGAAGGATGGGAAGGTGGGTDPTSCVSRGTLSCPTALLCDGFDEPTFKAAWTVDQLNGTITDSDTCRYRGSRSAHAQIGLLAGGVEGHAQIFETTTGQPSDLFIRVFVRIDAAPADSTRFLTVHQAMPGTGEVSLTWGAGVLGLQGTVSVPAGTHALATGRWACVEWELLSGAPGTTHVWLDSADVIDGTYTLTPVNAVELGAQVAGHASAITSTTDIWLDDLVIDTARIGCN